MTFWVTLYPSSWGDLSPSTHQTTGWYVATTADLGKLPFGQSVLSGTNSFSVHTVDGFTIVAKKYGATVKPVNVNGVYSWVVTDVNPADTTDKPGDTYKVTSFKNTNGVTLYDFTWKDEGGTHGTWVFEAKGNFVTLGLPGIWTLASQGSVGQVPTPAADLTSYDSMSREIANLVKVP